MKNNQKWVLAGLVVVLREVHLHVEADELAQVPVREGLLRAEDGRDLAIGEGGGRRGGPGSKLPLIIK